MATRKVNTQISDISSPPPYINKVTGNWMIHNGEKYVDSGVLGNVSEVKKQVESVDRLIQALKDGRLEQYPHLRYLTEAFKNGPALTAGLFFTKILALSNNQNEVTAYLSGDKSLKRAILKAGIENFATPDEIANIEINHDGSAKFGDMHIRRNGQDTWLEFMNNLHTYMQIGGAAKTEYEMLNATTQIREFRIKDKTFSKVGTHIVDQFDSAEDNREVRYKGKITACAYAEAKIQYGYDGNDTYIPSITNCTVTLILTVRTTDGTVKYTKSTTPLSVRAHAEGYLGAIDHTTEIKTNWMYDEHQKSLDFDLSIDGRYVSKLDRVSLEMKINGNGDSLHGSSVNVVNYLPYDTSQSLLHFGKNLMSLFFGRQRYILFNYFQDLVLKVVGNALFQGDLEVTGAFKCDVNQSSGAVLAGAVFNDGGVMQKQMGKFANKVGYQEAQAGYDYSNKRFTVYHSIGHTNYIPLVTPVEVPWADQPSISNILPNSFNVTFYNGSGESHKYAFSYVCFKGD